MEPNINTKLTVSHRSSRWATIHYVYDWRNRRRKKKQTRKQKSYYNTSSRWKMFLSLWNLSFISTFPSFVDCLHPVKTWRNAQKYYTKEKHFFSIFFLAERFSFFLFCFLSFFCNFCLFLLLPGCRRQNRLLIVCSFFDTKTLIFKLQACK